MIVRRTEDGTILYNCYRASCHAPRGFIRSNGNQGIGNERKMQGRPFLGAYTAIPEHVSAFIMQKYGISAPKDWRWSEERQRILIPLCVNNAQWGWLARGFSEFGLDGPKADIFYTKEFIGFSELIV